MKSKLLIILIAISGVSILVFFWGTTNYLTCYTDTPGSTNLPDQCSKNPDGFVVPAIIATFVMMGIVITLTWMKTKNHKLRTVFTILSGIGIFFGFNGILAIILMFRN